MSKAVAGIAALLILLPATAPAREKVEPRMQALMACGGIAANDARLRCFDAAIAGLKSAVDKGQIVLEERKAPRALEGIVKATGPAGIMRYWVELDNGDRWQVVTTTMQDDAPQPGAKVKLRKGAFGNYWMAEEGGSSLRALFMDRRS